MILVETVISSTMIIPSLFLLQFRSACLPAFRFVLINNIYDYDVESKVECPFIKHFLMYKYNQIFGVDISKEVFDVMNSEGKHLQFENNSKGFNQLIKHLTKKDLIVMEAPGYYHYCLAQHLYDQGYTVSVVNPLAVKRFVQMKLSKIKTDKSDALAICQYACSNEVPLFTSKDSNQAECLQLMSLIEIYRKQSIALKNKLHVEKTLGIPSKTVYHSINRSLKMIQKEIQLLEKKLLELVKEHQ